MGDEFDGTTGTDAGAALQAAWFGGQACGHLATGTSRHHMTINTFMAEVRRVLYAAGRALKLCELRHTNGNDRAEIGSVLVKLQVRGLVVKLPKAGSRNRGASYLWVGLMEPGARQLAA